MIREGLRCFVLRDFQWKDGKRNVVYPFDLTTYKVQAGATVGRALVLK